MDRARVLVAWRETRLAFRRFRTDRLLAVDVSAGCLVDELFACVDHSRSRRFRDQAADHFERHIH